VPRVLILRHGESTWNVEQRWQGWEDAPLTPLGEAQALARARQLAEDGLSAVRVFASDLQRARRTAEILASELGPTGVVPDPGFRERHGGDWQGCTGTEIDAGWPGLRDAWRRGELASPPGGETDTDVLARFDRALDAAVASTGADLVTVVVTHHGLLRLVSTRAGVSITSLIPNLGGRWFTYDVGVLIPGDELPPLERGGRPETE